MVEDNSIASCVAARSSFALDNSSGVATHQILVASPMDNWH